MRFCSLFSASWELDELKIVARDGGEVVVEIQMVDGRLGPRGWLARRGSRGLLGHGDGGGAAQVVGDDSAVDVEG